LPLSFALAAVVAIAIAVGARPLSQALYGVGDYASALKLFGVTSGVLILSATPAAVVLVHNRVDWFNYSKLIVDVAKAMALVVGGLCHADIVAAMWVLLAGTGVKCAVDFGLVRYLMGRSMGARLHVSWLDVRTNLGLGLPMSGASIVNIGLTSGDRVIVSRMFGAEALARYSLAADICSKANFLVWALTGTVYPLVIRNTAARRDVSSLIKIAFAAVGLVALFIYLPIGLLAHPLITWWLGPAMGDGAATVTSIWAMVAVVYLAMTVLYNHLQARGRPWMLLTVNIVGLLVLAAGVTFLPKSAGIEAIAVLMGLVFLAQFIGLWLCVRPLKHQVLAPAGNSAGGSF
jgi:O-antigen/teichoic acid export membrane protein